MFGITDNKGFIISFTNGYSVSVQFGSGNYCANRALPISNFGETAPDSDTAETALMTEDKGFIEYQGDMVQGYMSPKDVLILLNYAENLPSIK
jgi:hypothetical protein